MIHHAYDFDDNDDDDGKDKNVSRQAQTKRVDRHCATNNQQCTSPDCRHGYIGER